MVWDALLPNFGVRITDRGTKTFLVRKRQDKHASNNPRHILGTYPAMTLAQARQRARELLEIITAPHAQLEAARALGTTSDTFETIAENFLERYVRKNARSPEAERIVQQYLIPRFGPRPIAEIKRRDIAKMMDDIEEKRFKTKDGRLIGGPVMADRALGSLRKLMNWYAARDDDFISPIVMGMRRTSDKERARERILTDDEIRAFWAAAQRDTRQPGTPYIFGAYVRVLLLTAQRRTAVAGMRRSEISQDGVWTIPASRDKGGKMRKIPLSQEAQTIIRALPVINECDLVFTTNGKTPFSGYGQAKRYLDNAMLKSLNETAQSRGDDDAIQKLVMITGLIRTHSADETAQEHIKALWWRLHDLRRTAKTLMMRAGIRPDISERVLSHEIKGVEGVYDRWDYMAEKRDAIERLEKTIMRIITSGKDGEVVALPAQPTMRR